MEDAFATALTGLGGESNYVELSKLKADDKIRSYFRRTLFKTPWEDETFSLFFQSRSDKWDYDEKTRGVRVRSDIDKQIQATVLEKRKKAPFPEALYTAMLRSSQASESMAIVSNAVPAELAATPVEQIEALLDSLGGPLQVAEPALAASMAIHQVNAQVKIIAAVPGALDKKGAGLGQIMEFIKNVLKFGGEQPDPKVAEQKILTLKELCNAAGREIREKGLGAVSPKGIQLLCQLAPFHIMALAISALGEKGDGEDVKACAATLAARVPIGVLEGLAEDTLIRLAVAATKSSAVAEATLSMVAKASSGTLPAWKMDDLSKMLLAISKSKAGGDSAEVAEFYSRAAEAVSPQLSTLGDTHLVKVAMVLGRIASCRDFLESLAEAAAGRAGSMAPPILLLLTQALLPLGGENASLVKILEAWSAGTEDGKGQLTADQFAKLSQSVAPVAPLHTSFWDAIGGKLASMHSSLTDAGWASVEAAFPSGEGPAFKSKDELMAALKAKKEKEEKKNRPKEKDDDRRKDRRDDRDERKDDRGRDRDRRDDRRDDRDRRDRDRGDDRRDRDRRDDRRDDRRGRSRSRRRR